MIHDVIFVTDSLVMFFLIDPRDGVFLLVLYGIGLFFCHHFMPADYDANICPQDCYACEVT
jgi:hypothetical protein